MDNTAEKARERAAADADLTVTLPEGVPLFFRRIPAGAFLMGQRGEFPDEEPVHRVTIPEDFYLGVFPVTQAQYRAMAAACLEDLKKIEGNLGADPSHFTGDRHPVEQVSWDDARCVSRWLTDSGLLPAGWIADLPSETQWESACRAGTETDYWNGNGEAGLAEVGWFGGNAGGETHPVGEKNRPNPFGLHDLHGNVAEWCLDYFDPLRYRKLIDGVIETALVDIAEVEIVGANSGLKALAGMLTRFAEGNVELRSSDVEMMKRLRSDAKCRVINGDKDWVAIHEATNSALRTGRWPAASYGVAEDSRNMIQVAVDAASGTTTPPCVLRGGSWVEPAAFCRSASHNWNSRDGRNRSIGFRMALVPGPVQAGAKGAQRKAGQRKEKPSDV